MISELAACGMRYATSRNVAVSNPDDDTDFPNSSNLSKTTIAQGLIQLLRKITTSKAKQGLPVRRTISSSLVR